MNGHGHVIPNADGSKARCGGPGICADCSRELTQFNIDQLDARDTFLAASVAVWREIDRLDAEPEGYHPVRMSVELRQSERAAWERYRDLIGSRP